MDQNQNYFQFDTLQSTNRYRVKPILDEEKMTSAVTWQARGLSTGQSVGPNFGCSKFAPKCPNSG